MKIISALADIVLIPQRLILPMGIATDIPVIFPTIALAHLVMVALQLSNINA